MLSDRAGLIQTLLENAGYQVALAGVDDALGPEVATGILDGFFGLLSQIQTERAHRTDMHERLRDSLAENDRLMSANSTLKSGLEATERQRDVQKNKVQQKENAFKELQEKTTTTIQELTRTNANLQATLAQCKHKLRKSEADMAALKERVTKATMDQYASKKIGMKLLNPAKKVLATARTLHGKGGRLEMDPLNSTIDTLEQRDKEHIAENHAMRRLFYEIFVRARTAGAGPTHDFDQESERIEEARFYLPLDMMQEELLAKFDAAFSALKQSSHEATAIPAQTPTIPTELVDHSIVELLRAEILEYKRIIERQNSLLDVATKPDAIQRVGPTDEEERVTEELEYQRMKLQQRSAQLDEERQKFTEAAIRLGRERAALEREREILAEDKIGFETTRLLQTLPPTPRWLKTANKENSKFMAPPQSPPDFDGIVEEMKTFGIGDNDSVISAAETATLNFTPIKADRSVLQVRKGSQNTPNASKSTTSSAVKSALKKTQPGLRSSSKGKVNWNQ